MRPLQGVDNPLVGLLAVRLLTAGGVVVVQAAKHTEVLAADHMMACIRSAVAAQPGVVTDVEAEDERGLWRCEVTPVDAAGTRHTRHVDVATNQVVKAKYAYAGGLSWLWGGERPVGVR